jgi:hypothetical protein
VPEVVKATEQPSQRSYGPGNYAAGQDGVGNGVQNSVAENLTSHIVLENEGKEAQEAAQKKVEAASKAANSAEGAGVISIKTGNTSNPGTVAEVYKDASLTENEAYDNLSKAYDSGDQKKIAEAAAIYEAAKEVAETIKEEATSTTVETVETSGGKVTLEVSEPVMGKEGENLTDTGAPD